MVSGLDLRGVSGCKESVYGRETRWRQEGQLECRGEDPGQGGGAVRWLEEIRVWPNPGSRTGRMCSSMGCRTGRGGGQSSIPFF